MNEKEDNNIKIGRKFQYKEIPALCNMSSLIEHLHNRNKRPISRRANAGSSERDLMSVCVKRRTRAYKQCAQNNNR